MEWDRVQEAVRRDPTLVKVYAALEKGEQASSQYYSLLHGQLFYKDSMVIPRSSEWATNLIREFHATPSGGHVGALRTYRRLAANVHWPEMIRHVTEFVSACDICQHNKYETKSSVGLLQPLPIPERVWKDISLDFISGLLRSDSIDYILVLVDRFSKYGHFVGLKHPFTSRSVAHVSDVRLFACMGFRGVLYRIAIRSF